MRWKDALSPRFLAHLLLLRPFLWAVFGVNIRGRRNLDGLERFILISNHNSHLDTLLLFAALPTSKILKTHAVAASDYFAKTPWLFKTVGFLFQPIWIDREGEGGKTLPKIQAALDEGRSIILFPEGTRGEPGELQTFRSGIGRIVEANRSVPVVPVFLEGPERAFPKKASFPLPLWNHVTIAPPQVLEGDSRDVTLSLQRTLESLSEEAHHARQRRPAARSRVFTVAVLGIDGCGKSTLSRHLATRLSTTGRSCLISDRLVLFAGGKPQSMQPLMVESLRRWIGAQAKQARSLARYKIPKLAELILRNRLLNEAGRWYRPDSVFMDGMPLLNLTAWAILYREEHFTREVCAKAMAVLSGHAETIPRGDPVFSQLPELNRLKQFHLDRMRVPDATVFLDVPPAVCVDRIESRGEKKQVHETKDKLTKLREAYLMVCSVLASDGSAPVLVVDGDRPLEEVVIEAEGFVRRSREAWSES